MKRLDPSQPRWLTGAFHLAYPQRTNSRKPRGAGKLRIRLPVTKAQSFRQLFLHKYLKIRPW